MAETQNLDLDGIKNKYKESQNISFTLNKAWRKMFSAAEDSISNENGVLDIYKLETDEGKSAFSNAIINAAKDTNINPFYTTVDTISRDFSDKMNLYSWLGLDAFQLKRQVENSGKNILNSIDQIITQITEEPKKRLSTLPFEGIDKTNSHLNQIANYVKPEGMNLRTPSLEKALRMLADHWEKGEQGKGYFKDLGLYQEPTRA